MATIKKILILTLFISICIFFTSCEEDFSAEIPSYIEITSYDYSGNNYSIPPHPNGYENYHSTNISDAWVSLNGQIIGTFEIPCKIPILTYGDHTLTVYPGIKTNGISSSRIKYPFYEKFETNVTLLKDESITINPTTHYKEEIENNILFKTKGQFEISGTMFEKSNISDTTVIIQSEIVFQGQHSAAIYLDSTRQYFDVRNIEELELTNNTFLEMDFKSNIEFNVGILIINNNSLEQKEELIRLYATDEWKKIYLDLSPLINTGNINSKFKIYFEGNYNEAHEKNNVYIDNLKLVYN